jgi:hypothetical protein
MIQNALDDKSIITWFFVPLLMFSPPSPSELFKNYIDINKKQSIEPHAYFPSHLFGCFCRDVVCQHFLVNPVNDGWSLVNVILVKVLLHMHLLLHCQDQFKPTCTVTASPADDQPPDLYITYAISKCWKVTVAYSQLLAEQRARPTWT